MENRKRGKDDIKDPDGLYFLLNESFNNNELEGREFIVKAYKHDNLGYYSGSYGGGTYYNDISLIFNTPELWSDAKVVLKIHFFSWLYGKYYGIDMLEYKGNVELMKIEYQYHLERLVPLVEKKYSKTKVRTNNAQDDINLKDQPLPYDMEALGIRIVHYAVIERQFNDGHGNSYTKDDEIVYVRFFQGNGIYYSTDRGHLGALVKRDFKRGLNQDLQALDYFLRMFAGELPLLVLDIASAGTTTGIRAIVKRVAVNYAEDYLVEKGLDIFIPNEYKEFIGTALSMSGTLSTFHRGIYDRGTTRPPVTDIDGAPKEVLPPPPNSPVVKSTSPSPDGDPITPSNRGIVKPSSPDSKQARNMLLQRFIDDHLAPRVAKKPELPTVTSDISSKPRRITSDNDTRSVKQAVGTNKKPVTVYDAKKASTDLDTKSEVRMGERFADEGYAVHFNANDSNGDLTIDGVATDVKHLRSAGSIRSAINRSRNQGEQVILDGTTINLTQHQAEAGIKDFEVEAAKRPDVYSSIKTIYVVKGDGDIYIYRRSKGVTKASSK